MRVHMCSVQHRPRQSDAPRSTRPMPVTSSTELRIIIGRGYRCSAAGHNIGA